MKPLIIIIIIISLPILSIYADSIEIYIRSGVNIAQHYGVEFGFEEYKVDKGLRIGANAGLSIIHPVAERVSIQQDVLYSNGGSTQDISIIDADISFRVKYNLDYLLVPTLLKLYNYRNDNFSIYSLSGFSFAYMIYYHYTIDGTVTVANKDYPLLVDKKIDGLDRFDFGIVLGGGWENSRLKKNRFLIEYRVNFGIPFIDLPTTEDVLIEGHKIDDDPQRVKLRNLNYSLSLGYRIF